MQFRRCKAVMQGDWSRRGRAIGCAALLCLALAGCAVTARNVTPDEDQVTAALSQDAVDQALQAPELSQVVTARAEHRYGDMVALLQSAANSGNPIAQLQLAQVYARGTFVAENQIEADIWLHRAGKQGLGEAQVILAERSFAGTDGRQDARRGWRWLRSAEGQQRPVIWAMVGKVYLDGVAPAAASDGSEGPVPSPAARRVPDIVAARYYFQRAADADNVEGEMALCFFYMQGQDGQAPLPQKGQPWCDRAAARGNMEVRKYTSVQPQLPAPLQKQGDGTIVTILDDVGDGTLTVALAALYILSYCPDLLSLI